jgi:hypothetical protein
MPAGPQLAPSLTDQTDSILRLLDRAAADPSFLARLSADPLGQAAAAGIRVSAADLKELLGLPGATDAELVEVLRTRITRSHGGCGGCSPTPGPAGPS